MTWRQSETCCLEIELPRANHSPVQSLRSNDCWKTLCQPWTIHRNSWINTGQYISVNRRISSMQRWIQHEYNVRMHRNYMNTHIMFYFKLRDKTGKKVVRRFKMYFRQVGRQKNPLGIKYTSVFNYMNPFNWKIIFQRKITQYNSLQILL